MGKLFLIFKIAEFGDTDRYVPTDLITPLLSVN